MKISGPPSVSSNFPSCEVLRTIFEQSVMGIFQSSIDGRNLVANPAFARILGYESPAAARDAINDVATKFYADPDRRSEISELIARNGGFVTECESLVRRADGSVIWVSENTRIILDGETGEPVFVGSIVDISDRKQR